jgi:hypothetical protein
MRTLVTAALVAGAFAMAPLGLQHAGATITGCGGCPSFDPIVTLSDGTSIRAWVQVDDSVSDVQKIDYTLHIPAGLGVRDVSYSGPAPQTMQVIADGAKGGAYRTDTLVTTGAAAVPVVASTTVNGHGNQSLSGSVGGLSNSTIVVLVGGTPGAGHGNGNGGPGNTAPGPHGRGH